MCTRGRDIASKPLQCCQDDIKCIVIFGIFLGGNIICRVEDKLQQENYNRSLLRLCRKSHAICWKKSINFFKGNKKNCTVCDIRLSLRLTVWLGSQLETNSGQSSQSVRWTQ